MLNERRRQPSPDPFALRNPVQFISSPPAAGALKAILRSRQWSADEEGRPVHVHCIKGGRQQGQFSYRIVLGNGDALELAERELALDILRRMGIDTAWLHMLLLAYTARIEKGEPAVIERSQVWRALVLKDDHRNVTWKNQRSREEIQRLSSLGVSIDRLMNKGEELTFDRKVTTLWRIDLYGYGQRTFLNGHMVDGYLDWQLLVTPGGWADTFLYGVQNSRQLGYMAREMFDKVDRERPPWGAISPLLTFKARYDPGNAIVRVTTKELIEFAGGEVYPVDKRKREGADSIAIDP